MNKMMNTMATEMERELCQHIIPFWQSMKDEENGGYYGLFDYDLRVDKKATKGCILNSRILWFFSGSYILLKDEQLLAAADHAYDFMIRHCMDTEMGGIYWSMNFDGTVLDATKHTYNQAFAIYALSRYYRASGREEALQYALELFDLIEEKMRDEDGYLEAFGRDFSPCSNEKLSENGVMAERTMNTALHVLEAYTGLYEALLEYENKEQYLEKVKGRLVDILIIAKNKIYNPELKRQEVFFDKDYNSLIDLHSYGHDIEASWLIDRAVEVLGENAFSEGDYEAIRNMTLEMVACVYDKAFNGYSFYNECEKGIVDTTCIWWVHAEAVVGFANAYGRTKDGKYLDAAEKLWDFIKKYIVDKRTGSEWYWEVKPDGTPIEREIAEPWKCPYHNGRMCFEMIERAREK